MGLPEKKYTLVESFFIFLFGGVFGAGAIALIAVIMRPLIVESKGKTFRVKSTDSPLELVEVEKG